MIETFKKDVEEGLSKTSKTLPSKYFYDSIGDQIFIKIMNMPAYYLTRAEHDIFKNQTEKIIQKLKLTPNIFFEIIELGAGDGTKTKLLLKELIRLEYNFKYAPIDISENALKNLKSNLNKEMASLEVSTKQGDYFEVLDNLKQQKAPKVVLFLGSNIGNMSDETAKIFLTKLSNALNKNDKVLLGVDMIKSEHVVLPAYNDKEGLTKSFNMNLLDRINKELEGDFNTHHFEHLATYTQDEGIARSYLVSKKNQEVSINTLDQKFSFIEGEKIHTETSRKYNDAILEHLLEETYLKITDKLMDSNEYFADYILTKI
ncbi:L-histidine N(alpha)-methyltransferase [uncultured Polaribacter sp.]|uniref:L-histidine N(alpha)-methyltransferase n=1 Tax=uncultured Polaribacter sp. TaxID=174711 RepID=UPI00261B4222|nr:L-histidine N(alpha)-methyltransferase [uncultured Polaribacter sp.]